MAESEFLPLHPLPWPIPRPLQRPSPPQTHPVSMHGPVHAEWNKTAETAVFQGYFSREGKGQSLTPAQFLTQLSSPALELYLR